MCENVRKKTKHNFLEAWLRDDRYKFWICKVPSDDTLFHCIVCNKNFSCGSSHVSRHADSACHKKNSQKDIFSCNDDDDDEMSKVKAPRRKMFQPQWLEIDEFKSWLRKVPHDDTLCFCSICDKTISVGLSHIYRHAESKTHIKKSAMSGVEVNKSNEEHCNMQSEESILSFIEERKSAEIRFATLIAEKDIPYQTAKDILCLFKEIGKNPNVLKHMSIGKTKCKNIISNILCPVETERVVNNIQHTKYSIYINETSDDTNKKWMILLVRYVDLDTLDIRTQLVKVTDLDADCSVEKVFLAFKNEMENLNIPFANIVALSCNDAPVTTGKHVSLRKKLEKTYKHLQILTCPCYSTALVTHAACATIPAFCEEVFKKISAFIKKSSPKRSAVFQEFTECFQQSNHKILKLTETRWLSRQSCISRLLQYWDTIKHFLTETLINEKSTSGEYLLSIMQNVDTKAYFLFLNYILNFFNTFNAYFQVEETRIHLLQQKSFNLLVDISQHFLKPEILRLLPNVTFHLEDNQRPLEIFRLEENHRLDNISLGEECEEYLSHLIKTGHIDVVTTIRDNCLQFYIITAEEILKRLPITNKFLCKLKVFKPQTSLFDEDRKTSFNDVSFIAETLGDFDKPGLKEEWFQLSKDFTKKDKQRLSKMQFDEMWKNILLHQKSTNVFKYPNLTCLLNAVRSLPNSNADAEKVFSYLTDLKHKERNKLSSASINAMCVVKSALRTRKETALSIKIDEKHFSLMSSEKLYSTFNKKSKSSLYSADNNNIDNPDIAGPSICHDMQ
ncbi:uncharacterized protein LOC105274686 [Ooceraea biroi]|uniref:SCAN domain-containing protein n=1 Tax=Ooceraea biroi TaxID=2015173 RepID=A0A026X3V3_OOCBI|nr:uncharacterized protein LOC105274686 [Ooceraea biroi]XP_019885805.1 uncharacterized protein LOC105274686 [Ooceraea biroi]EZA62768.1 SCAN domain-containing protein [Ooceraea biroi]